MEENPYVTTPTPKTVGSRYQEQNSLTIPCQRLSMKEAYRSSTLHTFGLRWPSMNPISKPTSKEKREGSRPGDAWTAERAEASNRGERKQRIFAVAIMNWPGAGRIQTVPVQDCIWWGRYIKHLNINRTRCLDVAHSCTVPGSI